MFQRDAQTITPEALESVKAALASSEIEHKAETKKRAIPRKAAGQTWEDPTLAEWPESMTHILSLLVSYCSYQFLVHKKNPKTIMGLDITVHRKDMSMAQMDMNNNVFINTFS